MFTMVAAKKDHRNDARRHLVTTDTPLAQPRRHAHHAPIWGGGQFLDLLYTLKFTRAQSAQNFHRSQYKMGVVSALVVYASVQSL